MASSLSNVVDDLAEGTHKINRKDGHNNKNVKRVELNTKIVSTVLKHKR